MEETNTSVTASLLDIPRLNFDNPLIQAEMESEPSVPLSTNRDEDRFVTSLELSRRWREKMLERQKKRNPTGRHFVNQFRSDPFIDDIPNMSQSEDTMIEDQIEEPIPSTHHPNTRTILSSSLNLKQSSRESIFPIEPLSQTMRDDAKGSRASTQSLSSPQVLFSQYSPKPQYDEESASQSGDSVLLQALYDMQNVSTGLPMGEKRKATLMKVLSSLHVMMNAVERDISKIENLEEENDEPHAYPEQNSYCRITSPFSSPVVPPSARHPQRTVSDSPPLPISPKSSQVPTPKRKGSENPASSTKGMTVFERIAQREKERKERNLARKESLRESAATKSISTIRNERVVSKPPRPPMTTRPRQPDPTITEPRGYRRSQSAIPTQRESRIPQGRKERDSGEMKGVSVGVNRSQSAPPSKSTKSGVDWLVSRLSVGGRAEQSRGEMIRDTWRRYEKLPEVVEKRRKIAQEKEKEERRRKAAQMVMQAKMDLASKAHRTEPWSPEVPWNSRYSH